MVYESQISFTLDTICPWTYLGKKRLSKALAEVRSESDSSAVTFTVKYFPYQLFAEASQAGEDKYEWYKNTRYDGSDDKMRKYMTLMTAYGNDEGIDFKFKGQVANTLQAHRLIQFFQEQNGPETADKIVSSLYRQYFEEEKHPSSPDTLLTAATEAGIPENKAKAFIDDEYEGLMDVKMLIQQQAGDGIDAVPYTVFEGKRRDITLEGCKEVDEYIKALRQVIKECS